MIVNSVFVKITAIILFCTIQQGLAVMSEQSTPIIHVHDSWRIHWVKSKFTNQTHQYFYSTVKKSAAIKATCTAPFPIEWSVAGSYYKERDIWEVPIKFNVLDEPMQGSNFVIWTSCSVFDHTSAALQISCNKVGYPAISDKMHIFRHLVTSLFPPQQVFNTEYLWNSKRIPCLTSNPEMSVALYRKTFSGAEVPVQQFDNTLLYQPTYGFSSDKMFEGEYICKQNTSLVRLNAYSSSAERLQVLPDVEKISVLSDEHIELKCSDLHEEVAFIINETSIYTNSLTGSKIQQNILLGAGYIGIYTSDYNLSLSYELLGNILVSKIHADLFQNTTQLLGKVHCIKNSTGDKEDGILKEWQFEFILPPILKLDQNKKIVECNFPYFKGFSYPELESIVVRDVIAFNFLKNHLSKTVGAFTQNRIGTRPKCFSPVGGKFKHCQAEFAAYPSGLVKCKFNNIFEKQLEIIESLDQQLYSIWTHIPKEDLVRIHDIPDILYTNNTSAITCELLRTLFRPEVIFEIEFLNGSRNILIPNNVTVNISQDNSHPKFILSLNYILKLETKFPIDAIAVHCNAGWRNSTETVIASRHFETRHLMEPQLIEIGESLNKTFYIGDINRRLKCLAKAEPEQEYTWYFNKSVATNVFPELVLGFGTNKENYIEFPRIIGYKYDGEFTCVASNVLGNTTLTYRVIISEKPAVSIQTAFISTSISGFIFLLIIMGISYHFFRKYKNEKEEKRNLTDREIEDFFQGNKELMGNASTAETVDFMPYKEEFKIPLNDLEFTFSDHNLLGSGEYAFVVRGLIISKGKTVALKMPKPSTNITIFKSMLSEVKIMIHIGSHENLLSLVGVCTDGIKHRSIYIATDICGLGSLDKFLVKSRTTFVNLINANQQIDISLQPPNSSAQTVISTTDLISFASQTAKGMEYLSHKSVIHADLAARNVLLTSEKTAKISDFGLSKRLYENSNYVKKSKTPLPWRWMALESLETLTFSTKSDVWAYGVTLYEIFTLGNVPFPNEQWNDEFVEGLKGGIRMGRPEYSTPEIYSNIIACWENLPDLRPDFGTLRASFEGMMNKYHGHTKATAHEKFNDPTTENSEILENGQSPYSSLRGSNSIIEVYCATPPNPSYLHLDEF